MADAGVNQQADIHASQALSAAAGAAVAVQDADVLQAVLALAVVAQVLSHSLTLVVAVAVVVATVQTNAGIVTQDTLVATVAADQLDLTIVLHTVQVAAAEQVLLAKDQTVLAVTTEHQQPIRQDLAAVADLVENKEFRENRGVTVKDTAIIAVDHTVVVVADLDHHTVADLAARARCALYGQLRADAILADNLKIETENFECYIHM